MNNIKILNYTNNPLRVIGTNASYCYDTELKDDEHPMRIAKHCINSGHGRNLEFADVTLKITCSARCAREWFTHIGGSPTRVQASTRYITYDNFEYHKPSNLTQEQGEIYDSAMKQIMDSYKQLKDLNTENDITGYILPLAMQTTFIWKGNVRTLENMFNQRLCTRALQEYRDLMKDLKRQLSQIDDEWKWISDKLFVPKCAKYGYCIENNKKCKLYKEKQITISNSTS